MATNPNLQRKLQQALGPEASGDMLAWMHSMDAHRSDIAELRRELQLGFARMDERFTRIDDRFTRVDERFAGIDERFARMDGRLDTMQATFDGRLVAMQVGTERMMEKAMREQTRFFFLAWSVLLAAIIGLYARA